MASSEKNFTECILRKLDYNTPYYGKLGDVMRHETDYDSFPYTKFYRSVYNSFEPTVYERKAGYRALENKYGCRAHDRDRYVPDLVFSAPGSTTYPGYPTYFYEYASEVARNNGLNRYRVNTST
jgi:hypothetical protein